MSDLSSFVKRSFGLCLCVLVLGWLKYNEVKTVQSMAKIQRS